MKSSFSELNYFWEKNYFNPNLIILKSATTETRSNLFLDLIIHQAFYGKVYICCSSKYLLEDKINSLNLPNKQNICFLENVQDIASHYQGVFFFYEPSYIWMPKIQWLIYNNKRVVVDYNLKESFCYNKISGYQEIEIREERSTFFFKIIQSNQTVSKTFAAHQPIKYIQFEYYLESPNLKTLFEKFFQEDFKHYQISIKNYFPESLNIFSYNLQTLLTQRRIKSHKFLKMLKECSLNINEGILEINCVYINLCFNLLKHNPSVKIDHLYKLLRKDLKKAQQRRPFYNFFKYFKEEKAINLIVNSNLQDFCFLESIEMDFDLLKGKNEDILKMIPRKVQNLSKLRDFTSKITYRYNENKKFPKNIFHLYPCEAIFSPRDFFQLYEIKLSFRNCVSIYLNEILDGKKIIIKVTLGKDKFCVALDDKHNISSIKLPDNKEPTQSQASQVEKVINEVLEKKGISKGFFKRIIQRRLKAL